MGMFVRSGTFRTLGGSVETVNFLGGNRMW